MLAPQLGQVIIDHRSSSDTQQTPLWQPLAGADHKNNQSFRWATKL